MENEKIYFTYNKNSNGKIFRNKFNKKEHISHEEIYKMLLFEGIQQDLNKWKSCTKFLSIKILQ